MADNKERFASADVRLGGEEMRTELIDSDVQDTNYGAGDGDVERYEYKCPCGKGSIVEEHDNTPGFREHDVFLNCKECAERYQFDTSRGVRAWELIEK